MVQHRGHSEVRASPTGLTAKPDAAPRRSGDQLCIDKHAASFGGGRPRGTFAESNDPLYSSSAVAASDVGGRTTGGGSWGLAPALSFGFVNVDDDAIGLTFTASDSPGVCSEPYYGYVGYVTVQLLSQPKATVLFTLTSSLPSEAAPSLSILVVTADDWTIPQSVGVVSIDDPVVDGDVNFNVTIATLFSDDPDYGQVGPIACFAVVPMRQHTKTLTTMSARGAPPPRPSAFWWCRSSRRPRARSSSCAGRA